MKREGGMPRMMIQQVFLVVNRVKGAKVYVFEGGG